jgi:O-antigen ligase
LPVILIIAFTVALCVAGGASREDVLAQAVIRGCAVGALLVQIVAGRTPILGRSKMPAVLLGGMAAVAALQLIPLPPSWWAVLPGRDFITMSPIDRDAWRPINLVPDAGWNSLFALLVPFCMLVLVSTLGDQSVRRLTYLFLGAVLLSAVLALLQAAGSGVDNPLINAVPTGYAGIFANRNHQALFLSIGIAIALNWGLEGGGTWRSRRFWLMLSIVSLFEVSILVAGSRSGMVLSALAIIAAPLLARRISGRARGPKIDKLIYVFGSLIFIAVAVSLSAYLGRALSLQRVANLSLGDEFRLRSLGTVQELAGRYFPVGSGLGSFDAIFRMAEPNALLEPTYLNHVHNDFIEFFIETGVLGSAVGLAALVWLCRRAVGAFNSRGSDARLARTGALIIVLVAVASISDYPARTPMIMAVLVVAARWLNGPRLPASALHTSGALPFELRSL